MADNTLYQGVRNAAAPPDKMKTGALRACLTCKLLKTMEQFRQDGCDNCGELSGYDTQSYTTPTFKGTIAMMKPTQSWVARWQKQETLKAGLYAVQVFGTTAVQNEAMLDDDDI